MMGLLQLAKSPRSVAIRAKRKGAAAPSGAALREDPGGQRS